MAPHQREAVLLPEAEENTAGVPAQDFTGENKEKVARLE